MNDLVTGKFRLVKSENFDAFLAKVGVGFVKRKLAQSTTPEITISRDGHVWTMVTSTAIATSQISFVLGREFPELRQDGVTVTSCVVDAVSSDDGNGEGSGDGDGSRGRVVWRQTQKQPAGAGRDGDDVEEIVIVREFTAHELRVRSTIGEVSSDRVYERV